MAWREIGGEVFVVDLRAQQIFGLNDKGGEIWQALEAGQAPGEGSGQFCRQLLELGLVEGEAPSGGADGSAADTGDPALPRVVWQEPLRSFGFSCAFQPGQSRECTRVPNQ